MRSIAITVHPPEAAPGADREDPLDARVDTHFGRTRAILFVEPDGGSAEIVPNEHVEKSHGAGNGVAAFLAERGARTAIAADFGPNAYRTLQAAHVAMWKVPADTPVRECLRLLREGALEPMRMELAG